jgi:hypothetical protein
MEIFLDGRSVTVFEDTERPFKGGRIGLYSEDADVLFTDLALK